MKLSDLPKVEWRQEPLDEGWHPLNGQKFEGFSGKPYPVIRWKARIEGMDFDYQEGTGHFFRITARNSVYRTETEAVIKGMREGVWPKLLNPAYGKMVCYEKVNERWDKNNRILPPEDAALWSCLRYDAEYATCPTFEDFAEQFGYDPDSRNAEKMYNECRQTASKLNKILNLHEFLEMEEEDFFPED